MARRYDLSNLKDNEEIHRLLFDEDPEDLTENLEEESDIASENTTVPEMLFVCLF